MEPAKDFPRLPVSALLKATTNQEAGGLINLVLTLLSARGLSELPRKALSLVATLCMLVITSVRRLRERQALNHEGESLAFEDASGTRHEVRASPSAPRSCKHSVYSAHPGV